MADALTRRLFRRKANINEKLDPEKEGLVLVSSLQGDQFYRARFTVLNDERIIVLVQRGSLFLCSLRTGDRLQTYKNFASPTLDVELLEDDIFAEMDSSIITRRISDGTKLDCFEYQKELFYCSASLGDGRFLVGTTTGEVLEMQCSKTGKLLHNRTVGTTLPYVNSISACKDRFAVFSVGRNVVLVFEIASFERVAALEVCSPISGHLTDHLLVIGCRDGKIFIYNSLTLKLVREIQRHSISVMSVHVMGDGCHLLSAALDGLICIQDMQTGAPIWQKLFNTPVTQTTLLSDGRLVTGFSSRSVVVLDIPRDFEIAKLMVPPPTPIRDAFESCISGTGNPSEVCKKLIRYEKCRESFDEWCCAHQLLMMAVEDGDIPGSRNYNGEISWWFDNLYIAAKDIPIRNNDDVRTMKRFLEEAKKVGVVEGIECVLGDRRVTKDVKAEIRALQRADILLLERMMSIEVRLHKLKQSFELYHMYARNSQLIGIALQIIPIVGGSVAGIVSAGAEIVAGLSAKDLTEYFLGLGSSLLLDEGSSMSDRVFSSAASAVSQEHLEKMKVEHRRKLEEVVESWGLSLGRLRELFLERAQHGREVECENSRMSNSDGEPSTIEVVIEEVKDEPKALRLEAELVEGPVASSGKTGNEGENNAKLEPDGASCATELRIEQPSSWRLFDFDKNIIRGLCQEELASLWASYIVWNSDERQEEYEVLQKCLDCVLKEEHLVGELIVDSSALSSDELVRAVTTGMEKNGVEVRAGDLGRVRKFVSAVHKED